MKSYRLIYKIVGCLLLVSFAIAFSVAKTLYDKTIEQAESNMGDVAFAMARLIDAVAESEIENSAGFDVRAAYGTTIGQISTAFHDFPQSKTIGEILFVRFDGQNIEVVVHQERDRETDYHRSRIDAREPYAQAIRRGGADNVWIAHVERRHDNQNVVLAVAPVKRLGGAVVVETLKSQVLAPFKQAAANGLSVAALVISVGAFFMYRQSRQAVDEVLEANETLSTNYLVMQRNEDQLATLLNTMQDGFALYDSDDRLVFCNAKYKEMYKAEHGDAIVSGARFEDILRAGLKRGAYPLAKGREEDWLRERMAQHRNPTEPIEQKLADGRWLRIAERKTSDGGTVGFRTDITELKEKESALFKNEQRFKDFSETASDWAWETDANHRFVYLSEGLEEGRTFDNHAANGRSREELTSEDITTEKWRQHLDDQKNHRPFKNFEYALAGPDKSARIVTASGRPVFDDDGTFVGYRGTGRDVTIVRSQQAELAKAETQFRRAFEAIAVGIVMTDTSGIIKRVNPEASKIFGYDEHELIGKNVNLLMPPGDSKRHGRYMNAYLETGKAKIIGLGREVVGMRKSGESFPLNLGIADMTVDDERQFLGSIVDMSKEKALENQLRHAQKMESVGQLVGGIAHDFNNILGIIIGNLDLVRRKLGDDEKLFRQVDRAVSAANRGASLTRRLLNFSRQEPTKSEPIDVNDSIRNVHELLQRSITTAVEIKLCLAEDLPRAQADPGDFQDALVNLAVNARDAMPGGGILRIGSRVVTLSSHLQKDMKQLRPGTYTEIDVSDTGSGMSDEVKARIFDPFFTTKETGKGTGLGLAMVYSFARRSGGAVTVYSEQGAGTSFKLFLPVANDISDSELRLASRKDEEGETLPRGTETVMVVDDEKDLAEVAASSLEYLGYRVIVRHSGVEAMEILAGDETVDLLLSDVVMPGGISGYELVDAARHIRPALPVCLVSGFTGDISNGAIRTNENYHFLQKPYDIKALALKVRDVLDANQPDNT